MLKGVHLLQQFQKTLERMRSVITWYVFLLGDSTASLLDPPASKSKPDTFFSYSGDRISKPKPWWREYHLRVTESTTTKVWWRD
jgi:hypothetical protein